MPYLRYIVLIDDGNFISSRNIDCHISIEPAQLKNLLCYVPTITISATIEIGDSNVDKSWWLYQTVTNLVVTRGYPVDRGIFFDCQKFSTINAIRI
jgi:hypothetical protein